MLKRLPALMRDFPAFKPSDLDGVPGYTADELLALIGDQDTRWKAMRDAERKQKRRSPRR